MTKTVKIVKACADYRLEIEFTDGLRGRLDMSASLFGPVFEPLRDAQLFAMVYVDEYGAICWPNGADLAPDALYDRLAASQCAATSVAADHN